MNDQQIAAARELIDFARSHAEDTYGDEDEQAIENMNDILKAADELESYVDTN